MAETERDITEDWLPPPQARPPTVAELEQRIDVALAVARAAEAAALEIGGAALDAADQARRAAELAERASARVNGNGNGVARAEHEVAAPPANGEPSDAGNGGAGGDPVLDHFTERADRVMARLRAVAALQ
jgi:hypothetical protein